MKTTPNRSFYIVIGLTVGQLLIGATPVAAQGDCRLVFDATSKVFGTPAHLYVTTNIGGKSQSMEEIYAAGAIYVNVAGKWSAGQMTTQDMKAMEQKNIKTNKSTCRYLHDEPAYGEVAAVYSVHEEGPTSKSDSQVWISKAKGLPLRSEVDLGDKNHVSTRYEYGNVKAPI